MRASRLLRNRLLGAVRRLAAPARQWREARRAPVVELATVQRRLELLLEAMYGEPLRIVPRTLGAPPAPRDVVLPRSLPGHDDAIARYRLLAIEQGARVIRGTRAAAPRDALEADLYMVLEGAAIDAEILRRAPGLRDAMRALRREELARRPGMQRLVPQQRAVEERLRALLAGEPSEDESSRCTTVEESAARARELAQALRDGMTTRVTYRPIATVGLWDDALAMGRVSRLESLSMGDLNLMPMGVAASDDGQDGKVATPDGTTTIEADDVDDGTGEAMPAGERGGPAGSAAARDDGDGTDLADATDAADLTSDADAAVAGGTPYPEWITRYGRLAPRHVTVRSVEAAERDDAWAREALREHGPLLRQVRDRFALLRAHRLRLRAQRAGDELDLDACIGALVDHRMGRVPTDRLYQTTRPTRHALAIAILVDVSGSTKTLLPDGRTVLDVERLSLLLASEALDALGDPYAILTFSGLGRHDVRVATVKGFAEHDSGAVHRRISSLEPQDNTRLGAAVRHATAVLQAQPAGRRVLLILSDGRPNDVDRYQGMDAIEDSRQAVLAARTGGVLPFCLTVDSEEADYLPRLFGQGAYQVISEPGHLPGALIRLVDRLLRG